MIDNDDTSNLLGALECLLFMADRALSLGELSGLLDISIPAVRQLLEQLQERYIGITIVEVAGGFEMMTKPEFSEYVTRLHEPPKLRISTAAMETLAIVAYRQPITRPEVEQIRGVNSDRVVATLLEHGFLTEQGQKETPGRPTLYGTTDKFLKIIGLPNLTALPELDIFIEQETSQMEGFTAKE